MQGLHRLTAYTEERRGVVRAFQLPSTSKNWESVYRHSHSACRDIQEEQGGMTGYEQSSSWAPEGEDSPVSVIGHNMAMQVEQSHPSSAGSSSLEHSLVNFNSAPLTASMRGPSKLMIDSTRIEAVDPSDLTLPQWAPDYAGLLSQRVQQAFRKSHELQSHVVKSWPSSATGKQMESRNLQEDAPLLTSELPSTRKRQIDTTATGGRAADARPTAVSSEEEKFSFYSSSITDGQDDEDSLIDFFPASKDKPTIEIVNKHESVTRRLGSSSNERKTKVQTGRRALSISSGSWVNGRNEHGPPIHSVADHPKAELGRLSASYKWDDAQRWIYAAGPARPPETPHQRRPSFNVDIYGRLPKFAAPVGTRFMQVQRHQPSTEPTILTQDKHVPACVVLDGGAMREAGTAARNDQCKRDVGTQSTPAGLSQCDSPEVCAWTSSAGPKSDSKNVSDTETTETAQKVSPPRHNTPERRSVSCAKERGKVNLRDDSGNGRRPLRLSGTGKLLDLAELQSCHLEKLNLEQDLPLGTSSTWLLLADDEDVDLPAPGCPPHHQPKVHSSKVNMLEARVAAWEDVERAKYIAKFKKEEAKIEAWESLQRAEANADLQKLEVKLQKIRFESNEKIMGRLGAAQRRAQEMRCIAEAQKREQLTRLATRANQLRKSGHLPSAAFNVMCSLSSKIKPTLNLTTT